MKRLFILLTLIVITLPSTGQFSSAKPANQRIINKSFDTTEGKVYYSDATILLSGIATTFILSETATSMQDKQNKAIIGATSTVILYYTNRMIRKASVKHKYRRKKRSKRYFYL